MTQIEAAHKTAHIGMEKYLSSTPDWMMQCVKNHEGNKKLYSITKKANDFSRDLSLEEVSYKDHAGSTAKAKIAKQAAKQALQKQLQNNWCKKALHGQFAKRVDQPDVDKSGTFQWLKSSSLKAETEGFLLAAQDQSLKTRNYLKFIMKTGNDPTCRFCHQHQETIDHLVSGCPILAKKEYLERHNKVAQYVHWKVCQHYGIKVLNHWYEHQIVPVTENERVLILWDFAIQTDRTIMANRPDIVIRDKAERTCLLLDVAIPTDRNTSLKTYEKLSKYKDLDIELQKSWNVKTKTIPIIIGALGVINKSLPKYLKEIPGNIAKEELQKIALLGTARILRKALSLNAL